jgi:hypothetical protein
MAVNPHPMRVSAQRTIDMDVDYLIGNPRVIPASPDAQLEALRVCQAGGSVLWEALGPGECDCEFRSCVKAINRVWTVDEAVAARLLGYSPHWSVSHCEMIQHSSGGRVVFWYRLWHDDGKDDRLRGRTFQLKVIG